MVLVMLSQAAFAGFELGLIGGAGLPLDRPTASEAPGLESGVYAGYRGSVGPLHLQPELVGRLNSGGPAGGAVLGGLATFGSVVSVGGFAHGGIEIVGANEPTFDAGAVAEVRPPLAPLAVGLRIGWERANPAQDRCGDCDPPSDQWLVLAATAGLSF